MKILPSDQEQIDILRRRIEELDEGLIKLLAERMRISKRIGILKNAHGLPIVDKEREAILKELHGHLAVGNAISSTFIDSLFALIFTHSHELQGSKTAVDFSAKDTSSTATIYAECAESVKAILSTDKI